MPDPAPHILTEAQSWVEAVCSACGWSWKIGANAGRAAKLAQGLRAAGGTVDEFTEHYGQADTGAVWWWYRDDWRGKRGQRPSQVGINETWGSWTLPIAVAAPVSKYAALLRSVEADGNPE